MSQQALLAADWIICGVFGPPNEVRAALRKTQDLRTKGSRFYESLEIRRYLFPVYEKRLQERMRPETEAGSGSSGLQVMTAHQTLLTLTWASVLFKLSSLLVFIEIFDCCLGWSLSDLALGAIYVNLVTVLTSAKLGTQVSCHIRCVLEIARGPVSTRIHLALKGSVADRISREKIDIT
jgi:hypothetical protein